MDYYNYLKSLHLIFVITWFAGLFYIVRLFVYQIEAAQNHRQKRDFSAVYNDLPPLVHYHMAFCYIGKYFCVLDAFLLT
jgi:uncharacterized membrane protein